VGYSRDFEGEEGPSVSMGAGHFLAPIRGSLVRTQGVLGHVFRLEVPLVTVSQSQWGGALKWLLAADLKERPKKVST
jgi:hypothetical protein